MKYKSLPLFLLLMILSVLSGCASPKYNYIPQTRQISEPELNTVVSTQVGDEMVHQGNVSEHDAIHVASPIKVGAFSAYTIMTGFFKKAGEDDGFEFYIPYDGGDSGSIAKNSFSDPWKCVGALKKENLIGIVTGFNAHVMVDATGVTWVKKTFRTDNSFQQTLIYSGKVDNRIRLAYREFSNNLARPAFNNNVEYDLNESKIIGYKGARLEIMEATNQSIKFKLLKNFIVID